MSQYSRRESCKANFAASVKKNMPLATQRHHRDTLLFAVKALFFLGFPHIALDFSLSVRHKYINTKLICGIITKGGSKLPRTKQSNNKPQRLLECGALNPHPEKVREERFSASTLDFFDPRDLIQVKYEMLRTVDKEGRSVKEASRAFGFSRTAFYQAQSQFKEGGVTGLAQKRPGPKSAHKLTDEIMEFIENNAEEDAPLRARKLAPMIREKFGKNIHPRSIERAMTRRKKKKQ